ncbi:DUF4291 domain-containing protein [Streptomyces sp. JV176]|uniref:DUF4291 domain-containing protein n=1 Tax=Streptomyces sp. JV176 TaxID=858630 RepID=UPI002E794A84|nr:DUF4291 domain-containing protein [Streptomyces sp. JV176]MEE1804330.1 DUF4291 domain-containing protein [Streptomyces sp. JV176]
MTPKIRAAFMDDTITVYQAYPARIADPAVAAGTFVDPFRRARMTWIKPSFLWMMYRSGWATKPDQERILSIQITREGFEWALSRACLSHFDRTRFRDKAEWRAELESSPVRVQWDPDRDIGLNPLSRRAIQIGLSGEAVERYLDEWIVGMTDITGMVGDIRRAVRGGDDEEVAALLPVEREYPLPEAVRERIVPTRVVV